MSFVGRKIWVSDDDIYATDLTEVRNSSIPPGGGCDFYGDRIPEGYKALFARGQAVSRTTYADLFDVIGTKYGIGDGSTTFNLPDRRKRVAVGWQGLLSDSTLEACESAWTASTNVTATTSTDRQQGSYSVKLAIGASFTTGLIAYKDISSKDLSGQDCITFWIKPNKTLEAGYVQLVLDDTSACASPLETIDLPTLYKDQWNKILVYLANPYLDTAIVSIGLKATADFGATDIYIDDFNYGLVRDETIEDFETTWTDLSSGLVSCAAVSAIRIRGSYCLRWSIGTNYTTGIFTEKTIAKDLSRYGCLILWARSSIDLNAGDMQLVLDDAAGWASPVESLDFPALSANVWTRVVLRFASNSYDRNAIIRIGLKMVVDKGIMDFHLDDAFVSMYGDLGFQNGEEKHEQTVSELVAHDHNSDVSLQSDTGGSLASTHYGSGGAYWKSNHTYSTGSSTPFNIVQPFLVINYLIYY